MSAMSLLESGEECYIKVINNINKYSQFRSCVRVEVAVLGCPS